MNSRHAATLPALNHFNRISDDIEAQASIEADLEEARKAASLLGKADPWVTCATLLAAVQGALNEGLEAWHLLDAAEGIVLDLRVEWGGEDWEHVSEWTTQLCDVAALDHTARGLRQRAREARQERLAAAEFKARRLAVLARKAG